MAAPLITTTNPTNGGVNEYLNVHIQVTFDQAMLESSLTSNTLLVYRAADYTQIEGMLSYDSSSYTSTFIPVKSLDESSGYTFIIVGADSSTDCAKNAASESLVLSDTVQFTTGSDIYEPPQTVTDPTNPEDEVAESPTDPVLEPAVCLDFCVTDTTPDNRQTNVGTALPSGRAYIPEPSGFSSVYVEFNYDLWPSGVAYLDWMTIKAEPVNGDPAYPAAVPAGYNPTKWGCAVLDVY